MLERVFAQVAGMPSLSIQRTNMNLSTLLGVVITWIGIVAGVVAFAYLVYSGFIYLTAGGNPDAAKKGQQGILNAIIGLVIIALSWIIVTAVIGMLNPTP